jgi:hypothetical protein
VTLEIEIGIEIEIEIRIRIKTKRAETKIKIEIDLTRNRLETAQAASLGHETRSLVEEAASHSILSMKKMLKALQR